MALKHAFTNPKADGPDTTIVRPSDWNADHVIDSGGLNSAGDLHINVNSSEKLTVLTNGNVGIGTTTPSSLLELSSTTQAFLPPRMTTTQRNAIATPSVGMTVYDTTLDKLYVYEHTSWKPVANGEAIYVGPTAPTDVVGNYVWVETGLGVSGTDFTFWIEDGL